MSDDKKPNTLPQKTNLDGQETIEPPADTDVASEEWSLTHDERVGDYLVNLLAKTVNRLPGETSADFEARRKYLESKMRPYLLSF